MSKQLAKDVNILASMRGFKMRRPKAVEAWCSAGATVALDVNGNRNTTIFFAGLKEARRFLQTFEKNQKSVWDQLASQPHASEW